MQQRTQTQHRKMHALLLGIVAVANCQCCDRGVQLPVAPFDSCTPPDSRADRDRSTPWVPSVAAPSSHVVQRLRLKMSDTLLENFQQLDMTLGWLCKLYVNIDNGRRFH